MTNRVQTNRLSIAGERPAAGTRAPGELYVNWPDMQLGSIDESKNPNDLVAIRFFSSSTSYNTGDLVVQGGHLWHANQPVPAGPFNAALWDQNTTNNSGSSAYLPLAGGTMTGSLILASDPISALGAATKEYVDGKSGAYLPLTGGTLTGSLTVSTGNLTVSLGNASFNTLSTVGAATFGSTMNVTGTATFGSAITANSNVTLTAGSMFLNAPSPGGIYYFYDRGNGGGNRAAYGDLYRDGNNIVLNSSDNCGVYLYGATVVVPGNLQVNSTTTTQGLSITVGTPQSSGANAGWQAMDRDNAGLSSMLYGTANIGRLWRSDVGDCFTFGPAGNCVVAGTLQINGNSLYCPGLTTWGANFYAPGGYPLYVHVPNGASCYMNFTIDNVRAFYVGQGPDQIFRIMDASVNHGHIQCNPANNQVTLGGATVISADSIPPSGMLRSGTVNGFVANAISATTAISNYASFGHDTQNGNSYLSQFTINGQAAGVGSITTNGSNTFFNTSCDGRRKDAVRPLASEIDIGRIIDAIEPVAFEWTHLPDKPTGYGFVAQDLHKVVPDVVRPGSDDDPDLHPWSADFSKLIPYMIAEMQQMRMRIAELEARHV